MKLYFCKCTIGSTTYTKHIAEADEETARSRYEKEMSTQGKAIKRLSVKEIKHVDGCTVELTRKAAGNALEQEETKLKTPATEDVQKKLADMESLHRIQVQNGRHYFWNENDDVRGKEWQGIADKTKAKILAFKEEHGIQAPNWWD